MSAVPLWRCFDLCRFPFLIHHQAHVESLCAVSTTSHNMANKISLTSSGAVKAAGSTLDEQAQHPAFPAQTRKWLRVDDKGQSRLVKGTEQAQHCRLPPPCLPWHYRLPLRIVDVVDSPLKLSYSGLTDRTPICCLLCVMDLQNTACQSAHTQTKHPATCAQQSCVPL